MKNICLSVAVIMSFANAENLNIENDFLLSLQEVSTIATKTKTNIDEVPSTITVIKETDIQNMGAKSVYEVLNLLPNLELAESGAGNKYIIIRGQKNTSYLGYDKVKVFIDGMPVETYSASFSSHYMNLPSEFIERIEILRGAGSLMYGAGAFGGVINIITKSNSKDLSYNEFDFDIGSGRYQKGSVIINRDINGIKVGVDTHWLHEKQHISQRGIYGVGEGFSGHVQEGKTNDKLDNVGFGASLSKDGFYAKVRYLNNQQGNHLGFIEYLENPFSKGQKIEQINSEVGYSNIGINFDSDIKFGFMHSSMNMNSRDIPDDLLNAVGMMSDSDYIVKVRSIDEYFYLNSDFTYKAIDAHTITTGFSGYVGKNLKNYLSNNSEYVLGISEQNVLNPVVGGYVGNFGSSANVGVYVQDLIDLDDKNRLVVGIRGDKHTDFDLQKSYQIGLWRMIDSENSLKVSYANAFRLPTYFERNNGYVAFHIPPKVPNLSPEKANNFEVSYIYKPNETDRYAVTFYYIKNRGSIDYKYEINEMNGAEVGVVYFENYESIDNKGVEFEMKKRINERLNALFNISYGDSYTLLYEPTFTRKLELTAPILVKTILNYQLNSNIAFSSFIYYRDEIKDSSLNQTNSLEDFLGVDFITTYRYSKDLKFNFVLKNLLDERIKTISHNGYFPNGVEGDGFGGYLSMKYEF